MKEDIKALIRLLDDPDEEIYGLVTKDLYKRGTDVIPYLEKAWEGTMDGHFQRKVENIIQGIQFNHSQRQLSRWLRSGAANLLEGATVIAKNQYPELKSDKILKAINKIEKDVWIELNEDLTAIEKIKIINHILFEIHKFKVTSLNYNSPQSSYINNVLDTKKGNPVSLGIIYLIIAQNLELPIYAIDVPNNFLLAYFDIYNEADPLLTKENILFFVNPYHQGELLSINEVQYYLKKVNIIDNDSFYLPNTNSEVIENLLLYIIDAYQNIGHYKKVALLKKLLHIIEYKA